MPSSFSSNDGSAAVARDSAGRAVAISPAVRNPRRLGWSRRGACSDFRRTVDTLADPGGSVLVLNRSESNRRFEARPATSTHSEWHWSGRVNYNEVQIASDGRGGAPWQRAKNRSKPGLRVAQIASKFRLR